MNNKTINVVYATDYNYLRYTIVSIYSMLHNLGKGVSCNLFLLVPKEMPDCSKTIIQKSLFPFSNYSLKIIKMGDEFDNAILSIKHITTPTYYRLLLPYILDNVNKCVYLDGDTIVAGDISELYNFDLGDDLVGGVKSISYSKKEKITRKRLAFNDDLPFLYINAGVLLLNLNKMRALNISNKMLELLPNKYEVQDQDIINVACRGKIVPLPMYFNLMTKYVKSGYKTIFKYVSKEEYMRCLNNPTVIHFADRIKPWNNLCSDQAYIWYKYSLNSNCWWMFDEDLSPKLEQLIKKCSNKRHKRSDVFKHIVNRLFVFSKR